MLFLFVGTLRDRPGMALFVAFGLALLFTMGGGAWRAYSHLYDGGQASKRRSRSPSPQVLAGEPLINRSLGSGLASRSLDSSAEQSFVQQGCGLRHVELTGLRNESIVRHLVVVALSPKSSIVSSPSATRPFIASHGLVCGRLPIISNTCSTRSIWR